MSKTVSALSPAVASAYGKLSDARTKLKAGLIARDEEVDLILTALIACENPLFVGPPGTAKSMLADETAKLIDGKTFSVLLNKFTVPEDVFGQVSLTGLQNDEYRRVTTGKLPECDVAFLDEIFKAGPSILNTALKILNERVYDNGTGVLAKVPLKIAIAASNEWPSSDSQELGALFDRFVIRKTVRPIYVGSPEHDRLLFGDVGVEPVTPLTLAELGELQSYAAGLPWSEAAKDALLLMLRELSAQGIQPGDRRKRKAVGVARAYAVLHGATKVEPEHLEVLSHVLWDDPREQPAKCASVVQKIADPSRAALGELLALADEISRGVDVRNAASVSAACSKLADVGKRMRGIGTERANAAVDQIKKEIRALQKAAYTTTDSL